MVEINQKLDILIVGFINYYDKICQNWLFSFLRLFYTLINCFCCVKISLFAKSCKILVI